MNEQKGYGDLTNLISLKRVWMTEHNEGTGADSSSPIRFVQTFFDEDGKLLCRNDRFANN